MSELPTGTVTFLLTDIESSSTHWESSPDLMRRALATHDEVVHDALAANGGVLVKHTGDGNWCAFTAASSAVRAAIDIQKAIQAAPSDVRTCLRVRVGLHTGEVTPTGDDYFGSVPNRVARVADLANGDQIVCSSATAGLLAKSLLRSDGKHELRGIGVDEIFVVVSDEFEGDDRPLRRPVVTNNLPATHTSFLGRAVDVERAVKLLAENRSVVTLLGPGGVGKTRLAVEVGSQIARSTDTTVVFSDLSDLREGDDVLAAVADAVGARQQPGMNLLASIADFVHDRQLLLILDNCEQAVGIVGQIVDRLSQSPGVDLLATSRAALRADGEQLLDVEPLDPTQAGFDLFISRATENDPGFELGPGDAERVQEITERLDGVPLAIELAAARVRLMSPAELVAGLDDRFALLRSGKRSGRQETLHEMVMWSYQLLTPMEATVFTRLAVFAGGATLEAIGAICSDDLVPVEEVPDVVLRLTEQSMVVGRTTDGYRRFRLLETMRGFGEERLREAGEIDALRARHADHFVSLAAQQDDRIFSADEHDAWRVFDAEWANFRLALDTLVASDRVEDAIDLIGSLRQYATLSMRFELFAWADELVERPGVEKLARFGDLCGIAALGAYLTASGRATELANRGLEANPDDPNGWCRVALAAIFLNNVHTAEASDAVTSAWLATNPATTENRLWAEGFRAFHLCTHGLPDEAGPHARVTSEIARDTQSGSAWALASWAQGMVVSYGDLAGAITMWSDAREVLRSFGRSHLIDQLLVGLVLHFTVQQHDVGEAIEGCREALSSAIDDHYYAGTSHLFGVTAIALCRSGDAETGAKLLGAMVGSGHMPRENATQVLRDALGERFERHQTSGSMLSVTQAGHLALEALAAASERHQLAAEST